VTLKKPVLWSGDSKKNHLFTADVQNDAPSPARDTDQWPCRKCSAECSRDAITVTWKTRHLHHFTLEQNKVSTRSPASAGNSQPSLGS